MTSSCLNLAEINRKRRFIRYAQTVIPCMVGTGLFDCEYTNIIYVNIKVSCLGTISTSEDDVYICHLMFQAFPSLTSCAHHQARKAVLIHRGRDLSLSWSPSGESKLLISVGPIPSVDGSTLHVSLCWPEISLLVISPH